MSCASVFLVKRCPGCPHREKIQGWNIEPRMVSEPPVYGFLPREVDQTREEENADLTNRHQWHAQHEDDRRSEHEGCRSVHSPYEHDERNGEVEQHLVAQGPRNRLRALETQDARKK